jgi:hypothetical protein
VRAVGSAAAALAIAGGLALGGGAAYADDDAGTGTSIGDKEIDRVQNELERNNSHGSDDSATTPPDERSSDNGANDGSASESDSDSGGDPDPGESTDSSAGDDSDSASSKSDGPSNDDAPNDRPGTLTQDIKSDDPSAPEPTQQKQNDLQVVRQKPDTGTETTVETASHPEVNGQLESADDGLPGSRLRPGTQQGTSVGSATDVTRYFPGDARDQSRGPVDLDSSKYVEGRWGSLSKDTKVQVPANARSESVITPNGRPGRVPGKPGSLTLEVGHQAHLRVVGYEPSPSAPQLVSYNGQTYTAVQYRPVYQVQHSTVVSITNSGGTAPVAPSWSKWETVTYDSAQSLISSGVPNPGLYSRN